MTMDTDEPSFSTRSSLHDDESSRSSSNPPEDDSYFTLGNLTYQAGRGLAWIFRKFIEYTFPAKGTRRDRRNRVEKPTRTKDIKRAKLKARLAKYKAAKKAAAAEARRRAELLESSRRRPTDTGRHDLAETSRRRPDVGDEEYACHKYRVAKKAAEVARRRMEINESPRRRGDSGDEADFVRHSHYRAAKKAALEARRRADVSRADATTSDNGREDEVRDFNEPKSHHE